MLFVRGSANILLPLLVICISYVIAAGVTSTIRLGTNSLIVQRAYSTTTNARFQIEYDILINGPNVRVLVATPNCTTAQASSVASSCTDLSFGTLEQYFPTILDVTRRFEDASCFCLIENLQLICSCDKVFLRQNETVDFGSELYGTCEKECAISSRTPSRNRCFVDCKRRMAQTYRQLLQEQYENGRSQLKNITLILGFTPRESFADPSQYNALKGSLQSLETTTAEKSLELEKALDSEIYWLKVDDRLAAASELEQQKFQLLSQRGQSSLQDYPVVEMQQKLSETRAVLRSIQDRYASAAVDGYFDPVGDAQAAQVLAVNADCRKLAAQGAAKTSSQLRRVLVQLNQSAQVGQNTANETKLLTAQLRRLERAVSGHQAKAFHCNPHLALAQSLRTKIDHLLVVATDLATGHSHRATDTDTLMNDKRTPIGGPGALQQVSIGTLVLLEQLAKLNAASFSGAPCEISLQCGYAQFCDPQRMLCKFGIDVDLSSEDNALTGDYHQLQQKFSSIKCNTTADCPNGGRCLGSTCGIVTASTPCANSGSCGQGYTCESSLCSPVFGSRHNRVQFQPVLADRRSNVTEAPPAIRCMSHLDCGQYQSCHNNTCVQQHPSGSRCLGAVHPASRCGNSMQCRRTRRGEDECVFVPSGYRCSSDDDDCGDGSECLLGKCRRLFQRSYRTADVVSGSLQASFGSSCESSLDCGQFERCSSHKCIPVNMFAKCETSQECGNDMACETSLGVCMVQAAGAVCERTYNRSRAGAGCAAGQVCRLGFCRQAWGGHVGSAISGPASKCTSSLQCGSSQTCIEGRCKAQPKLNNTLSSACHTTSECGNGELCANEVCVPVSDGALCDEQGSVDSQCGRNMQCRGGACRSVFGRAAWTSPTIGDPCMSARSCGPAQQCDSRTFQCTALNTPDNSCEVAGDCGNGQICFRAHCANVSNYASCSFTTDCGNEMICAAGHCVPLYHSVMSHASQTTSFDGEGCLQFIDNGTLRNAYRSFFQSSGGESALTTDLATNPVVDSVCTRLRSAVASAKSDVSWDQTSPRLASEFRSLREKVLRVQVDAKSSSDLAVQATQTRRDPGALVAAKLGTSQSKTNTLQVKPNRFDNDIRGLQCLCALQSVGQKQRAVANVAPGPGDAASRYCSADISCEKSQRCVMNECVAVSIGALCSLNSSQPTNYTSAACGNGQQCVDDACRAVQEESACEGSNMCGRHQECLEGACAPLYGSSPVARQLRQMEAAFNAEANTYVQLASLCPCGNADRQ